MLYTRKFDQEALLRPHLDLCDVVTLWTWKAADLDHLDQNFTRFEQFVGSKRKVLGLYLWDNSAKQPMHWPRWNGNSIWSCTGCKKTGSRA